MVPPLLARRLTFVGVAWLEGLYVSVSAPIPVVCERDRKRTVNANHQREQRFRGAQEVCTRAPLIVSAFVAFFTGKRELALDSSAHRSCCDQ